MALENAGRDNREIRQSLIEFCEESFRRFPREDQLLTENRRRTMAQAYFDAGLTEKAEELFRSWLDADPAWGWGWIGWADCYLPGAGRPADLARAEKLLRRGYRVPGVRDRVYIAERLQEVCEDGGLPTRPGSSASRPNGFGSAAPPGRQVGAASRESGASAREPRANGQNGTQCPVPLRQREEVQEMLRFRGGPMTGTFAPSSTAHGWCCYRGRWRRWSWWAALAMPLPMAVRTRSQTRPVRSKRRRSACTRRARAGWHMR